MESFIKTRIALFCSFFRAFVLFFLVFFVLLAEIAYLCCVVRIVKMFYPFKFS